jgi:hypothetical protein
MKNNHLFYSFLVMIITSLSLLSARLFSIQIFAFEFEVCIFYFPTTALFLAWLLTKKESN